MVHYGVETDAGIGPLCGDWAGAPSWTKVAAAVSCPRCRALMARAVLRRKGPKARCLWAFGSSGQRGDRTPDPPRVKGMLYR